MGKKSRLKKERRQDVSEQDYQHPSPDFDAVVQAMKEARKQPNHLVLQTALNAIQDDLLVEFMPHQESLSIAMVFLGSTVHHRLHGEEDPESGYLELTDRATKCVLYELLKRQGCYEEVQFPYDPSSLKEKFMLRGPNLNAIQRLRQEFEAREIPIPPEIDEDSPEFARLLGLGGGLLKFPNKLM